MTKIAGMLMSPDQIAYRRRLGGGMVQAGMSTAPVQHWTQGLGRVMQGMAGGAMLGQANAAEDAVRADRRQRFDTAMNAGRFDPMTKALAGSMGPDEGGFGVLQKAADRSASSAAAERMMRMKMQAEQSDPMYQAKLGMVRAQTEALGRKSVVDQNATPDGRAALAAQYGLTPGTPAYQSYVLTGKVGRDEPLSSSDKGRIEKAENEYMKASDAQERLNAAREANKAAHQGWFADTRAMLGNTLPDWLVPDAIASPESADATRRYSDIMSQEAVKIMGDDLTGASTDFEMRKYMEIVADTSKPKSIREDALKRMIERGERHKSLQKHRMEDIRGGTYYKPGYEATNGPQPTAVPQGQSSALAPGSYVYDPATGELRPR